MFKSAIRTEIVINAPPDRVWRTLTTFKAYPKWNPFIISLEPQGPIEAGNKFKASMQLSADSKPTNMTPKFITVETDKELRWKGRLPIPGLFHGEHYFMLEPMNDNASTKMIHGERFFGLLIPVLGGMLHQTEENFKKMNDALKERSEDNNSITSG